MRNKMMMIYKLLPIVFMVLTTTACSTTAAVKATPVDSDLVVCTEPRPQVCTMDYTPVCATRETGNRCETTPCPTTEDITYSNGCSACSDKSVISYQPGSCEES